MTVEGIDRGLYPEVDGQRLSKGEGSEAKLYLRVLEKKSVSSFKIVKKKKKKKKI